jgi:hypothetical protein
MAIETATASRQHGYGPYRRPDPLPRHLDDVTAEWLAGLLANAYPGVGIERMERVEVRNSHTTKMRVAIEWNDAGRAAGLPRHLCLKSNWSDGFDSGDICQLEAQFYRELRSLAPKLPAAQCYYADWDDDGSGRGIAVLEDLVESGGSFGHATQLVGVDGVARALEALATLHAQFWNDPRLAQQSWLPRSMGTFIDTDQIVFMRRYIDANLARESVRKLLPARLNADNALLDRAYAGLNAWANAQPGPFTLVHGDCHIGNTYLYPDGRRIWLDWQLCRVGHAYRDMTYFMTGALTVEERRGAEEALIRHYRDALVATGVAGVPDLDTIRDHYRRWPIYGLQAWLQVEDAWGMGGPAAIERFSAAIEDHGTFDLLAG